MAELPISTSYFVSVLDVTMAADSFVLKLQEEVHV